MQKISQSVCLIVLKLDSSYRNYFLVKVFDI